MDQSQNQLSLTTAPPSRSVQFHPARVPILDLFTLYLGLGRNSHNKLDDSLREPPNKVQKCVHAINRELPPPNEQFILDFEQLQSQFPDHEQLHFVVEAVLIPLVAQCSGHGSRSNFLIFILRSLSGIGCINWDTFLPSLLSSVSSAELPVGQMSQAVSTITSSSLSQSGMLPPLNTITNSSNFQSSNPASPLNSVHTTGSPAQPSIEPSSGAALSPVKSSDISSSQLQSKLRGGPSVENNDISNSNLRQLCCKIILTGLEFSLKPVTHAGIFNHMLNWRVNWDQRQHGVDESVILNSWRLDKTVISWLHSCLDVIWLLVDEGKCRVPFYELLRSDFQFIENIPDDEALFTLILEIHRRRDMMALHMQMLDQHLHFPTFGTHRILNQTTHTISNSNEAITHLRLAPLSYLSVLGEPLQGEDITTSIHKGCLDWERDVRCIGHALRTTPSPDWWRRVLVLALCYMPSSQGITAGAVFSSEMIYEAVIDRIVELSKLTNSEINCRQDWLVFSDIFYFLTKSGCIDFIDFVDKLVSRLSVGDHHILRTNHVTWLLAQIIRIELVMNALNADSRKVETIRKVLSFHREDRSSDPSSPQSVLLDCCQNLRIWSLNTTTRDYLNNEQLQKGKQIDEWWRRASKGDRMMDYMNMDEVFTCSAQESHANYNFSKRITGLNPMFHIMPDMSPVGMPSFDGSTSENSADAAIPVQDDPHHRFYQHT